MGAADFNKKLQESVAGFVIDKVFSFAAGLAAVIIGTIFVPITEIVFQLYVPLRSFLESNIYYCIGIAIFTIIVWIVIWPRPRLRSILPYVISLVAIVVSGFMRGGFLIPNIIPIQFLLFFGGILMLCEALLLHLLLLGYELLTKRKPVDREVSGQGS